MELSRQMLLLTAENYGSYYLHITKGSMFSFFGTFTDSEEYKARTKIQKITF